MRTRERMKGRTKRREEWKGVNEGRGKERDGRGWGKMGSRNQES